MAKAARWALCGALWLAVGLFALFQTPIFLGFLMGARLFTGYCV